MSEDFDPAKHRQLLELLESNQKLEAIKRYRQWTRSSLLDAKNAIEQLRETGTLRWPKQAKDSLEDAEMDEVLEAIERGHKIEACKIYRTYAGCSLKEAKDFVEDLMGELGHASAKTGCLALFIASLLASFATAAMLA
ncbi:MAG: hypothetical protein AAFU85_29225 [Planctomycetota bacterium]